MLLEQASNTMNTTSSTFQARSDQVLVIGAGIIGLSTAFELLQRGHSVTLIDPNPPGSQCSSGNAGALSAFSVTPLAMPGTMKSGLKMLTSKERPLRIPMLAFPRIAGWLLKFVQSSSPERVAEITRAMKTLLAFSIERSEDLARRAGAGDLIRRTGQLHLYRTTGELAKDAKGWALRRDLGVDWKRLEAGAIQELEPTLDAAFETAIFIPDQGMAVNPLKYSTAIAQAFQAQGGAIVRDAVIRFLRDDNGAVVGAEGRTASYHARHLVIAAGAWSARLLNQLGIRVPLETQRGYHIDVPMSQPVLSRPVCIAARKVFLTPMDFGLRAAGIVEFGGLERPMNRQIAGTLTEAVREAFANDFTTAELLRKSVEESLWMGHRPCMPDSMPVIGPAVTHANVWCAFGHGHLGLTGAAATADVLARAISGEPTNIDLSPFSMERFSAYGA